MGQRASASRGAARFPAEEGGCGAPPLVSQRSPFAVLGVPRDASATQVKQAYRRLCAKYHPDAQARGKAKENHPESAWNALPPGDARIDEAADFLEIQRAYRTLKDRYARAQWERAEQEREREQQRAFQRLEGDPESVRAAAGSAMPPIRSSMEFMKRVLATLPPMEAQTLARPMARFWLALGGCALVALLFWLNSGGEDSRKAGIRTHSEEVLAGGPSGTAGPRHPAKRSPSAAPEKARVAPPIAIRGSDNIGLFDNSDLSVHRNSANRRDSRREAPMGSLEESTSQIVEGAALHPADGLQTASASAANRAEPQETASRASASASSGAPSKVAEWRGRWVAICIENRGTDLYRGFLEIADQGRFRWMSLGAGTTGRIGQLVVDASSDGDGLLRQLPGNREEGTERGDARGGVRAVATLEHRPSSGRWLRWSASDRRTSEADSANQPASVCPCPQWRLFADDGDAALEGLWVLPAVEGKAEEALATEYAELRLARKTDGFAGQFVGRYRVPVDSMPPEMRFRFVAPDPVTGWHTWQNADGVAGKVLLAPIGRSRIAVLWKRGSIPSGRPGLSGGVAVLRRME